MKKSINLIIYFLVGTIVILLLYLLFVRKIGNSEIDFKINTSNIELKIGNVERIDYEIDNDVDIIWVSDNTSVATVNNGMITGVGLGNTLIRGTATKGENSITRTCRVSTHYGEKGIELKEILVEDGELYISKGDSYIIPITYNPVDSYIKSIKYEIGNTNIIDYHDKIEAKNIGVTNIKIIVNDSFIKNIRVNVIAESITPTFSKKITEVNVDEDKIIIKPNETKQIKYSIEPKESFVEKIEWESSNNNVVTVKDGIIYGKEPGEAIVKLIINGTFEKEVKVLVSVPVTGIELKSSPVITLKMGDKQNIRTIISPENASNKNIKYTSSTNNVTVDDNGIVTGISAGSGVITLRTEDGNFEKIVNYTVNPTVGIVNGNGGIWGYTSPLDQIPERADVSFFTNLARNGKGSISGDIYVYSDINRTYSYNISKSILTVNKRNIYMRIYYPKGVDLSNVNTFTFFSGLGEDYFTGFIRALDRDKSLMKSSGIFIPVSFKEDNYRGSDAIISTEFVKSIVGQKNGVKNTIGGYSYGGYSAGDAAAEGSYDRLILCQSYFRAANNADKLKEKEIIFFSPKADGARKKTQDTIESMLKNGYKNITLVTNNQEFINQYGSRFLVINPGIDIKWSGHEYKNIINANVFSFANS